MYSKENIEKFLLDLILYHNSDIYLGNINKVDLILKYYLGLLYEFILEDNFFKKIGSTEYEKFTNYQYEIRGKITKEEFLEIRKILIEINKYEIYDFLSTFIDCRKKNDKGFYFEDIVPELYEDLKKYISDKYLNVEYGSTALIIRDIEIDINDYIYPLLGKKLSLNLFEKDIIFEDIELQNHIIEYINGL